MSAMVEFKVSSAVSKNQDRTHKETKRMKKENVGLEMMPDASNPTCSSEKAVAKPTSKTPRTGGQLANLITLFWQ